MFNLTWVMKKTILTGAMLMASTSLWAAEHWIDVRTPDQFQATHVEGAVNIPLADLKTRIAAEVPDKNDTIHVYCNVGRQSGQAQQMLSEMGYTQVTNEGGINQIALPKVENQ